MEYQLPPTVLTRERGPFGTVAGILDALHGLRPVCLVRLGEFCDAFFVNLCNLRKPLCTNRLASTVRACSPGTAFKLIDLGLALDKSEEGE
jgi:hypothetical protein